MIYVEALKFHKLNNCIPSVIQISSLKICNHLKRNVREATELDYPTICMYHLQYKTLHLA